MVECIAHRRAHVVEHTTKVVSLFRCEHAILCKFCQHRRDVLSETSAESGANAAESAFLLIVEQRYFSAREHVASHNIQFWQILSFGGLNGIFGRLFLVLRYAQLLVVSHSQSPATVKRQRLLRRHRDGACNEKQ